jgi:hypothetical protein
MCLSDALILLSTKAVDSTACERVGVPVLRLMRRPSVSTDLRYCDAPPTRRTVDDGLSVGAVGCVDDSAPCLIGR